MRNHIHKVKVHKSIATCSLVFVALEVQCTERLRQKGATNLIVVATLSICSTKSVIVVFFLYVNIFHAGEAARQRLRWTGTRIKKQFN